MRAARVVEVPANADFVIEGYVDPTELLRNEGPFGDHTGYYILPSPRGIICLSRTRGAERSIPRGEPYPVFHVTAITHRKDAVFADLLRVAS